MSVTRHRALRAVLQIAAVAAFFFAALFPAIYLLFGSGLVGLVVLGSCIILVADAFKRHSGWLFLAAILVLLTATLIGLFVHFRDSGESGPLPYEWLNDYYLRSTPLLLISSVSSLLQRPKTRSE